MGSTISSTAPATARKGPGRPSDRVAEYARDVVAGRIVAGKWVRYGCRRHLEDLEESGRSRGWVFSAAAADRAIQFIEGYLRLSIGPRAGKAFLLAPFQAFVVGSLFGWLNLETGQRRFRSAYFSVGRGNAKTTLAAAIGLYMLIGLREFRSHVYCAATKKDQAREVHNEAKAQVKGSPPLRRRLKILTNTITHAPTMSKFEPLGKDYDTLDGLNSFCVIVDEFHAHKSSETYTVLDTSLGKRFPSTPLMLAITTAGSDPQSPCGQTDTFSQRVLEVQIESGEVLDDTHFVYIARADLEVGPRVVVGEEEDGEEAPAPVYDEWDSLEAIQKANPGLGVTCSLEDIMRKVRKAREFPADLWSFYRRHLNLWTQARTRWIPIEKWNLNAMEVPLERLLDKPCFAGLDLATTTDLVTCCLLWPPDLHGLDLPGNPYLAHWLIWLPEETIRERVKRDHVPYDAWVRQGHARETLGNVVDYDAMLEDIKATSKDYPIREFGYDPWNAAPIVQWLQKDGFNLFPVRMGERTMSPPMMQLEALIISRRIWHGGNPAASWSAGNIVAIKGPTGSMKPDREKSAERIDPTVALLIALERSIRSDETGPKTPYEDRGIRSI